LGQQWQLADVRIITVAGNDVGWLQTTPAEDAIFVGPLYVEGRFQRQGIGSRVM
jgi:predicted N-acetyltransferase YhbS